MPSANTLVRWVDEKCLRLHSAGSTLSHLWPTGSSSGWPPSTTARYFSASPSDPTSRWTPCPPKSHESWLQVTLGCFRVSPSCPFRALHTCLPLRPARHYPRFWIRRPSSERRRDSNPPDQRAAWRALRAPPTPTPARERPFTPSRLAVATRHRRGSHTLPQRPSVHATPTTPAGFDGFNGRLLLRRAAAFPLWQEGRHLCPLDLIQIFRRPQPIGHPNRLLRRLPGCTDNSPGGTFTRRPSRPRGLLSLSFDQIIGFLLRVALPSEYLRTWRRPDVTPRGASRPAEGKRGCQFFRALRRVFKMMFGWHPAGRRPAGESRPRLREMCNGICYLFGLGAVVTVPRTRCWRVVLR